MNRIRSIEVRYDGRSVGRLAMNSRHLTAFEYDREWLERGFSIQPFSLPLQKGVFLPKAYLPFEGLFGVFADSLPDGWGRLLVDRMLRRKGVDPSEVSALERLAIVGTRGSGALEYLPEISLSDGQAEWSLDEAAVACRGIFEAEHSESLDVLFRMGGSSGGARPKVFYRLDGEEWIVKFPSSSDDPDIGKQEYDYARCAERCGIHMPEFRLFPSDRCSGYFGSRRFDREAGKKIPMISVSALLETSHRIPNLDYHILMKLVMKLTGSYVQIEQLYRRMCFNVFAHNRDDHSKNFSFLYRTGAWELSPAYDLTYSYSLGGEHATTVNGNGKNPAMEDLLAVARQIKWDVKRASVLALEIQSCVRELLGNYLR